MIVVSTAGLTHSEASSRSLRQGSSRPTTIREIYVNPDQSSGIRVFAQKPRCNQSMNSVSLQWAMKHFLRIPRISKTPRANEQLKKIFSMGHHVFGDQVRSKAEESFSVDKPVSETAQEPSFGIMRKILLSMRRQLSVKKEQHTQGKRGPGVKIQSYLAVGTERVEA